MKRLLMASALMGALSFPVLAADPPAMPAPSPEVPAGAYKLDKTHASLIFRVNHLGFSNYTGRFKAFDAELQFDPKDPSKIALKASVDATSLDIENPPPGFLDELKGPNWLDTAKYPTMTFVSTKVEVTGDKTAHVTGDFTMHGVTKPVILEVRFNGGWAGLPGMDPQARAGFSAKGTLSRSQFGISQGVPPPGTTMGVGDAVEVILEAEFTGPPLTAP